MHILVEDLYIGIAFDIRCGNFSLVGDFYAGKLGCFSAVKSCDKTF